MLTVGIDSHNPVNIVAVLDYVLERRLESGALSAVDAVMYDRAGRMLLNIGKIDGISLIAAVVNYYNVVKPVLFKLRYGVHKLFVRIKRRDYDGAFKTIQLK